MDVISVPVHTHTHSQQLLIRPQQQASTPAPLALAPLPLTSLPPPPPMDLNLPRNWKTARDPQGKVYYYHVITRKSQWERPTDQDIEGTITMELATPEHEQPSDEVCLCVLVYYSLVLELQSALFILLVHSLIGHFQGSPYPTRGRLEPPAATHPPRLPPSHSHRGQGECPLLQGGGYVLSLVPTTCYVEHEMFLLNATLPSVC